MKNKKQKKKMRKKFYFTLIYFWEISINSRSAGLSANIIAMSIPFLDENLIEVINGFQNLSSIEFINRVQNFLLINFNLVKIKFMDG